jgi:stage V sporulation protein AE
MLEQFLTMFFRAFLIGGFICLLGQILFDLFNFTPAHTMSILVSLGSVLGIIGLYPKLAEFAGFGATLPIVSFGNTLTQGALEGLRAHGFWGIFSGMLGPVSAGVAAAVVFGFLVAVVFKPKA